ncbi:exonuclease domain-containing protein [Paenibacillus chartarius]|uniref:Exonuclease domain-containing protein n=1 Tax=Paenibacillus chartarius TaxID=747481 RepID=A0ABV6DLY3_9BACL
MNYIVLDIEFNGRKFASDLPMEVIEIGAVKLNEELHNTGEFSSLIKPVYFAKLNSFIKQKTGIAQEEIDRARGFVPVMREFQAWLDSGESGGEAPLFVTWGGEDLKRIVLDTRMHKLDDTYWTSVSYFDLLKGFLRRQGLTNDVSVENALQQLGIDASGSAHRALDDARMTAEIFRSLHADLDLTMTQQYKDMFSNSKERRLVKNAVRALTVQKIAPVWSELVEKVLKDKVKLDDPRKAAELEQLFHAEVEKQQAARAEAMAKAKAAAGAKANVNANMNAAANANANSEKIDN